MSYNKLSPEETLSLDLNLKNTEIAWIAGLLEGEGTFGQDTRQSKKYKFAVPPSPYLKLRMSDKDVVEKFGSLVKKKVILIKKQRGAIGTKPIYSCYIGDRGTINYLLTKILPYMGLRRKKLIEQHLKYIQDWQKWYQDGGRERSRFNALK